MNSCLVLTLCVLEFSASLGWAARAKAPHAGAVPTKSQTIYVDATTGVDSASNRESRTPFATFTGALSAAEAGDTIQLSAGHYSLDGLTITVPGIHIVGAGQEETVIKPAARVRLNFTAPCTIEDMTFDTGAGATSNAYGLGSGLISLSDGVSRALIRNVDFTGIAGNCILMQGAVSNVTVEQCRFTNNWQPVFVDSSSSTSCPSNLSFTDCVATGSLASGFQVHCKDGDRAFTGSKPPYSMVAAPGGSTNGRQAPGLSTGLFFTRCSSTLASPGNGLAFEVWHGWQNVHFTDCYADGRSTYGLSCAYCYYVTVEGCTLKGEYSALEYADTVEMHAINCNVIDSNFGPNGQSRSCSFIGGGFTKSKLILYGAGRGGETVTGSYAFTLMGADVAGSNVTINHFSEPSIIYNHFHPADDGTVPANWITIINQPSGNLDFGGGVPSTATFVPFTLQHITIKGNKFQGDLTGTSAIGGISSSALGTNTINGLIIDGNETDGTYTCIGSYLNLQGATITYQHITNNVTSGVSPYPADVGFTNDAPKVSNIVRQVAKLTYASGTTNTLSFAGTGYQLLAATGNVTLASSDLEPGESIVLVVTNSSTSGITITFPAWTPIGAELPTSLAAGKTAVISLTSTSTTTPGVLATYSAQP